MDIITETAQDGITERRFDLKVGDETVPGLHWVPSRAAAPHPTVLIGHGGTQHKRVPNVLGLARKLVSELGYGVVALDAPGHGDRMTAQERAEAEAFRAARQAGGPLPPLAAAYREKLALLDSAIADLDATLQDNRYNAYLQTQLASLHREKQKTLEEWLKDAKRI